MADLTDEEEERIEPQPHVKANIDKIAELIGKNGKVARAEEKGQKARSDLGNIYQQIEKDFHGNIGAAKLVRRLESGTVDAAYDFMRTFIPLAERFGLIPEDDLVDQAHHAGGTAGEDGSGVIDFGAMRERRSGGLSALDNARDHLSGGTKADPPESEADKRKRERGFEENPPPGEPGDEDLARGPDEASRTNVAAE
jgi:hypothetical protein